MKLLNSILSLSLIGAALPVITVAQSPRADAAEQSPSTVIVRSDSQPFQQAPAEHFTGWVHITPLFAAKPPSRAVEKVSDEQYGPAPSTTKNQRKPTQKRDE